ncbi:MAG TPA: hypothetical protein VGZ02_10550 [Candidatus Baltobacteraceae bacterium]|nr:hypothetical protein [Candidatus Baltobacteraceae bacterium]
MFTNDGAHVLDSQNDFATQFGVDALKSDRDDTAILSVSELHSSFTC